IVPGSRCSAQCASSPVNGAAASVSLIFAGRATEIPLGFGIGAREQSLDVADAVRPSGQTAADHRGHMICNDGSAETHLTQRLHDLPHVGVTVIHERLDEVWQRSTHVAEMNFP